MPEQNTPHTAQGTRHGARRRSWKRRRMRIVTILNRMLTGISFTFNYDWFHLPSAAATYFPSIFFAAATAAVCLILTPIAVVRYLGPARLCRRAIKMSKFNVQFKCNTLSCNWLCRTSPPLSSCAHSSLEPLYLQLMEKMQTICI